MSDNRIRELVDKMSNLNFVLAKTLLDSLKKYGLILGMHFFDDLPKNSEERKMCQAIRDEIQTIKSEIEMIKTECDC